MYLQSIAHSTPRAALTQKECWQILNQSQALDPLTERSVLMLEKILLGDSGIERRHFESDSVETLFSLDAESLNQQFERAAPRLASQALRKALDTAELRAADLDALFICTCSGYLCPGLSSYVSQHMGLKTDTYLQDIVGLGCGAAIPTLRSAAGFLAIQPQAKVAVIAVEVCSAAFYLDNDPGVLISACLFGDAASASIWSMDPNRTGYRISNFDTLHRPEDRELLRFVNSGGKLRNKLHRSVPEKAGSAVAQLYSQTQHPAGERIANHTGGRDVIDALEQVLPSQLSPSRATLKRYGNTSSPSVLITLQDMLEPATKPKNLWLTSFGAGFAAHSVTLQQE
ncbi:MAG: putative naringenin-chalcone synthase [Lentimonas sp.]|jgi:predicted naringenin-chalcone synthase